MKTLRSILSVVVSYLMVYVIVIFGDTFLHHLSADYTTALSLALYALASLLGGWLCILWAPAKPRLHLLLLFILGETLDLYFAVASWHTPSRTIAFGRLLIWPAALWLGAYRTIRD